MIHRASYTVFVKETWDFDLALLTTDGEVFCYPRNIGVTNMLGMHMGAAMPQLSRGQDSRAGRIPLRDRDLV